MLVTSTLLLYVLVADGGIGCEKVLGGAGRCGRCVSLHVPTYEVGAVEKSGKRWRLLADCPNRQLVCICGGMQEGGWSITNSVTR